MLKQKDNPNNYLNAIVCLPRNMRNLYLHAYQSYLWNTCASLRLKRLGYGLVIGDFIKKDKTEKIEEGNQDEVDEDG